jgi:hypothetical protein
MLNPFIPKPDLDECPTCGAKNVFSIEDDRCEVCIVPPSMRDDAFIRNLIKKIQNDSATE